MAPTVNELTLLPETVLGFESYIREAEAGMREPLGGEICVWSYANPERTGGLTQGDILAEYWSGKRPIAVPGGLIHDWVGAAFVPSATIDSVLALIQDYDNHKNIYKPEVMDSKLISRNGDDFKVYLRFLKKKIITVVLETEHDVHYSRLDPGRGLCRSYTTRIAEVKDAGKESETTLPPDTGHGFLWRLYSYWNFQERQNGTLIECRAISLTRDIPMALKWIIQPMVRTLPKESLVNTLAATRGALVRACELARVETSFDNRA